MKKHHRITCIIISTVTVVLIVAVPLFGQGKKLTYNQAYMYAQPRLQGTDPVGHVQRYIGRLLRRPGQDLRRIGQGPWGCLHGRPCGQGVLVLH